MLNKAQTRFIYFLIAFPCISLFFLNCNKQKTLIHVRFFPKGTTFSVPNTCNNFGMDISDIFMTELLDTIIDVGKDHEFLLSKMNAIRHGKVKPIGNGNSTNVLYKVDLYLNSDTLTFCAGNFVVYQGLAYEGDSMISILDYWCQK